MGVPDFQTMMLPLLQLSADGEVRRLHEYRPLLAADFQLSQTDIDALLPSGTQTVLANRSAWASVYLQRAGLWERPQRGHYKITDRGLQVLTEHPERIDIAYLERFPEFVEFRRKKDGPGTGPGGGGHIPETPEEILQHAHQQLRDALADEILAQVKSSTPAFFERLVVALLVKMGYGGSLQDAGMAVGKSGDEGIDGIIKEDRLGLDVIYIQAKKWDSSVGRPEIQKFVGALYGKRARKGVFITTGTFSQVAHDYTLTIDPTVVLIDGRQLAQLMIDFGLGVTTEQVYEVKRVDSDFFSEET